MRKLYIAKNEAWLPPDDGFVYTIPQIDAAILREKRSAEAFQYYKTGAVGS